MPLWGGPDNKAGAKPKSKSPSRFKFRLGRSSKHGDALQGNAPHQTQSATPVVISPKTTLSETEKLWARAEDTLRSDPEKRKIFQQYLGIVGQQLNATLEPNDGDARHRQLCKLIDVKTRELEDKKWKLQIGDWNRNVGDLLQKSFKSVLAMKDLVNNSAAACPPAALACAGATIILSLLVSGKEQELGILEPGDGVLFQQEFEATLTRLYSQILEFQARAVCYLRDGWIVQTVKGVMGSDAWKGLLQEINKSEAQAQKFASDIGAVEMRRWFEDQDAKQDKQNVWQRATEQDKRVSNFLKTIYTCPYKDRKDRNRDREPGTCEWFTTHPRFKAWNESRDLGILWVSADPGAGKSILAKYLVDHVIPCTNVRSTCYFFFKDDFPDQRSSAHAVCALLRQLFIEKPKLLHNSVLKKCETDGDNLTASFSDLWRIFIDAVADKDAGEVVCILDALDECQESDRAKLISAINDLYSNGPTYPNLKFLCTSRPYGSIKRGFHRLESRFPSIHLSGENDAEVEKISREIDIVVKSRVKEIGEHWQLEPDEILFLEGKLMAAPQRTYLWIRLILDHIENLPGFTKGNVERAISGLPQTVDEAYNKILNRSSDPSKARKLLHAVVGAERPLSLKEIAAILAIERSRKSFDDISKELEPEPRFRSTIRDLCGLFIVVRDDEVYLLHQTAREFLMRDPFSVDGQTSELSWKGSIKLQVSNKFLAERCIWYLMSDLPNSPCTGMLEYSSLYWASHFRGAEISVEDELTAQATSLCDSDSQHFGFWANIYKPPDYDLEWFSVTSLTAATYLDLEPVVTRLVEAGTVEMSCSDDRGRTPLSWAASKGYHKIAKILIDRGGASIDYQDRNYHRAPLHWAAEHGHEEVVRLLLETGANVELGDSRGCTPLSLAAQQGNASVVILLLKMGKAAVDSREAYFDVTPLWLAAELGKEEIVEMLLKVGRADLEAEDTDQRTPLMRAALHGLDSIAKLLLQAGARVGRRDSEGDTALALAAMQGNVSVVERLIGAGAEVDSRNNEGETPLSWAAQRGKEGVIQVLLHAGANADMTNHKGETPLAQAALYGFDGAVKMLLDARANPDIRDNEGRTPLDLAVEVGRWDIAALLGGRSQSQ
ncbi:hypothetical protein H2200_011052 [Cladophialophora chaetospira]|uniref:NWD NACHT-NTPase N-terminal domain-containing protein n=1 Tax=Cladophialophora chaetospira TaxID=386627 RepID=A0AA38WZX5_9EURO|nr:hypothetical protein H2200_011052 [Cladophialophora chaetospira]